MKSVGNLLDDSQNLTIKEESIIWVNHQHSGYSNEIEDKLLHFIASYVSGFNQ